MFMQVLSHLDLDLNQVVLISYVILEKSHLDKTLCASVIICKMVLSLPLAL